MKKFDEFVQDEDGDEMMDGVVSVSIALILVATLGVAAWQLLGNATYTNVDPTTTTLVKTVIGIIAAIAIVILILRKVKS